MIFEGAFLFELIATIPEDELKFVLELYYL